MAGINAAIKIELGSRFIRVGRSGRAQPTLTLPSPRCVRCMHHAATLHRMGRLADDLAVALRDALIRQLGVRPSGAQVLCVLPNLYPDWFQRSMQHALLAHLGMASVAFTLSSCAAGISSGRWTALHVDVGYHELRIQAIAHGLVTATHGVCTSPCAGLALRAAVAYHVIAAIIRVALALPRVTSPAVVSSAHTPTVRSEGLALTAGTRLAMAAASGMAPIAAAPWQPWADLPFREADLSPHELTCLRRSVVPAATPLAPILRAYLHAACNAGSVDNVHAALPLPWSLTEFTDLPKRVALRELFEAVCCDELESHSHNHLPREVMTLAEAICVRHARVGGDALPTAPFPLPHDIDHALRPDVHFPPRCDAPTPLHVSVNASAAAAGMAVLFDDPAGEWRLPEDGATLSAAAAGAVNPDTPIALLCALAEVCDAVVETCRPEQSWGDLLTSALTACATDDRRALVSNIVFTGGAACMPGLMPHLLGVARVRAGSHAACGNTLSPLVAAFAGASALAASLSSLQRLQHAGDVPTADTAAARLAAPTLISMLSLVSHTTSEMVPASTQGAVRRSADPAAASRTKSELPAHALPAASTAAPASVSATPAVVQPAAAALTAAPAPAAADRLASLQRRLQKATKK